MSRTLSVLALLLAGSAWGAAVAAGTALLLVPGEGVLGATGVLIAAAVASCAAGAWAAGEKGSTLLRWSGLVITLAAGALFAGYWMNGRADAIGAAEQPLAVLALLAAPGYAAGLVFSSAARGRGSAGTVLFAVAIGVLAATLVGIPQIDPESLYAGCAALVALAAALDPVPAESARGQSMTDKVVLVSGVGAAGQVGYALAAAFLARGARVIVCDLNPAVAQLAAELGPGAAGMHADLGDPQACDALIAAIGAEYGALDALINAAGGLSVIKPLADTGVDEWEREMKRNARTAFLLSRAALPLLRRTRGAIVNFASPAGMRAEANLGAYSASKAAVIALTRALAIEEKEHGVRVNAVAPGMVDTEQNRAAVDNPEEVKWISREDLARVVVFLAGEDARAITGETIHVLGAGI